MVLSSTLQTVANGILKVVDLTLNGSLHFENHGTLEVRGVNR